MRLGLLLSLFLCACAQIERPAPSPPIAEGAFYLGGRDGYRFDEDRWRANVERIFGPGVASDEIEDQLRAQGFVVEPVGENGRNAKFSWPATESAPSPGCQPNVGVLWSELEGGEARLVATTTANC